jgi:hypothetical protein
MQNYGMVIVDQGANAIMCGESPWEAYAINPIDTDPVLSASFGELHPWGHANSFHAWADFPWQHLQLLQMNLVSI